MSRKCKMTKSGESPTGKREEKGLIGVPNDGCGSTLTTSVTVVGQEGTLSWGGREIEAADLHGQLTAEVGSLNFTAAGA